MEAGETGHNNFRLKLAKVASHLDVEKLERLKFLCADLIPAGDREKIKTPEQLFLELEQRKKIAPNRLTFLIDCLIDIGRKDLVDDLKDYERQHSQGSADSNDGSSAHLLRKAKESIQKAESYNNRGRVEFQEGRYENACQQYTSALEAIECLPQDQEKDARVKYFCNRASCYVKLRKFKEAHKDCDSVLLLDPRHTKARYRLVQSLQGEEKIAEAFIEVTSLLQKDPKISDVVQLERKLRKKVEDAKQKAMERKSEGEACFQKSDYHAAMIKFSEGLFMLPKLDMYARERKQLYCQRAECHLKKNNLEVALRDCDEADRLVAEDVNALYTKMQILERMDRCKECFSICNKLVEKNFKVAEAEETRMRLLPKIIWEDEESNKKPEESQLPQGAEIKTKKRRRSNRKKKGKESNTGTSEENQTSLTADGGSTLMHSSNTTPSLPDEGDVVVEEGAASNVVSETGVFQGSFRGAGSAEQRDTELLMLEEEVVLLDKEASVNSEDDALETDNFSCLLKPKIMNKEESEKPEESRVSQSAKVTPVKKRRKKSKRESKKKKEKEANKDALEEKPEQTSPTADDISSSVYRGDTTPSLAVKEDGETEEGAESDGEGEVFQGSMSGFETAENIDSDLCAVGDGFRLLHKGTFVEPDEDPREAENVPPLSKPKVEEFLEKQHARVLTNPDDTFTESGSGEGYPQRLLLICERWSCWHNSVCVVNRQLCRSFAKCEDVHVACLVLDATEQEMIEATRDGVNLIRAAQQPEIPQGNEELLRLHTHFPFEVDLVIGHGIISGTAAAIQANRLKCRRLHIYHNLPTEDEGGEVIERNLGLKADFVAGIGPLVVEEWEARLNCEVFTIIPGLPNVAPRNQIMTPQSRCLILGNMSNPATSGLTMLTGALRVCRQRRRPIHLTVVGAEREKVQDLKEEMKITLGSSEMQVVVKPFDVTQDAAGVEVRGVSLVLIPWISDGFGIVALEAIAAKVPILITSSSGIAEVLHEEFGDRFLKFLCSTGDYTDCADAWTSAIDAMLGDREEAFNMAESLSNMWNSTFSWDSTANWLLKCFGNSGLFSVLSPSATKEITLPSQCSESALKFLEEVDLLNRRRQHVLFLSPEKVEESPFIHYFAQVPWAAVFDFDVNSVKTGFLASCENFCETMGMKICRILPPSDEDRKKCSVVLLTGIPWVLLEGMPESKRSIKDNYDWMREFFSALGKTHQVPITFLVLWKSVKETEPLSKMLSRILTVVKVSPLYGQVKLVIASTGDTVSSYVKDIAEDWDVEVQRISLEDICNALCQCLTSSPFIQESQDFSLPVADPDDPQKVTFKVLPPSSRWINAEMEVLFQSIGSLPQFGTDDANHFYRGGLISWYALQMGYAVERRNWMALKGRVDEQLVRAGTVRLTMPHQRGAGGSTSARKILFDYHDKYPCVFLKSVGHAEVHQGIKVLAEFCKLPVIILVDCKQVQSDDFDVDTLYNVLSNDRIPCVILEVIHQHQKQEMTSAQSLNKSDRNSPVRLADSLDPEEAQQFIEVYSTQRREKLGKLRSLLHHPKELQIPFYYALTTFEDRFTGLGPFVDDCLQDLELKEQKILLFLAMAYHYGHNSLSANEFSGLLQAPRREVVSLESVLPGLSRELLIEEDGKWRPRHDLIAVEMLRQLLTKPGPSGSVQVHPENWKSQLSEKAIDFFEQMSEAVVSDMLLSRIPDDSYFSQLISDIPFEEDTIQLFEKAISRFPDNPYFKVHLGRFYSIQKRSAGFPLAIKFTDEGISCSESYPRNTRGQFFQMKGVVYSREINYLIEQRAEIHCIIDMAQEGVKNFRRAVSVAPDFVDGYIPEVRMMCRVFEYIDRKSGNLTDYMKSSEAHPFMIDAISDTSNTLECVPDSDEYSYWRMRLACVGRQRFSRGQAKKTLELLNYLRNSGRASRSSINCQIVIMRMDMCARNGDSLSGIAPELIELLNEALKYDTNIEQIMRLWVRLATLIPVALSESESKIFRWCTKTKSVRSYLYKYVIACLHLLEGSSSTYGEIMKNAKDDLNSEIKAISRGDVGRCRHPDRPVVWLGQKGKGMGHLMYLDDKISELIDVRMERSIDTQYTKQLRPLTGLILKTGPKVGTIRVNAELDVSFRADLCEPTPLVSSSFVNKKVQFFMAFNFFGSDAYNVRLVAE